MRVVLILLLSFVCFFGFSQSFQQALQTLKANKTSEAASQFEKIAGSGGADAAQAELALCLIASDNGHQTEAFDHFQRFFDLSPNPYPYVYALWTSGVFGSGGDAGKVKAFMTKLSTDPKADATLQAMAADNVGGKLSAANKIGDSKSWYAKMEDVKNWSTVGAFQNVSSSGFNKDFGVVAHPEMGYSFTNSDGAPVSWFKISDARNDRWWDFNYHYGTNNSIIYAQTFLQSDEDKDVRLMLGLSGSFKIWVNDFLVAGEAEERNTDIDVYQYQAKLNKGYNRILVQIGSSEINNSNFLLRIADTDGKLLTKLSSTNDPQQYTTAKPYEVKQFAFAPETFFEKKLATDSAFLDRIMLVNVYNHNDKRYEARKQAQWLKNNAPQSTMISEVLIETYSRDNNTIDLNKEIEFIKSNDSTSLYGLSLRYNEAIESEDYTEANRLLDKRIELYGSNADTEAKLIDLMAKRKDYEGLLKELNVAYKQYPDEYTFVALQYSITDNMTKDLKKSNEILVSYLKNNYNEDVAEAVISNKMKLGKKDEAFKQFKGMIEDMPYATMRYARISDKYFDLKDYKNALDWQQMAIDRAPYAGSLHFSKGVILEAAGRKPEALDAYKKAIMYDPSNYTARKKLRELEGKKDLFKSFKENDVFALFKSSPSASEYPNDNSIYLLKDMQEIVYPENGASEERNDLLIKIFNQTGIDDWKEVSIPYNGYTQRLVIDKAEIFKKDGSKVPAETNDNQIVFSSLEVGDAIHLWYKLETATSGKLAEHFWEDFNFNNGYPVKIARFSLLVPSSKEFKYKMYNSDLKPAVSDVDNFKLYVWEKTDSKAVQSEPYLPPFADISERIVVSSIPDWNYVANWYSDLSNVKAKTDFEIKEKVKELMAGKQHLTDLQKARIIYDYIEGNYNYSDVPFLHSALTPQRASRTLRTRLGDCKDLSTLFVAMGKEAGLNTNLVLVDTRDNGDYNLDLPTIGFNHCIAQLHADNKNYLVELTDNDLSFGAMSYNLLQSNGLYIPKDGGATKAAALVKLNTDTRPQNFINRVTSVKLNGSSAEVERRNTRIGAEAAGVRYNYKHKSEEDRNKDLMSSLSTEFNKKVTLNTFTLAGEDKLADSLQMNYNFTVDKFSSDLMGMQIFTLPWSDRYGSLDFISLDKRTYPLSLWKFSSTPKDKETMTLQLPAGKKLAEIPKNITLSHPAITYTLTFTVKPTSVVAVREVNYLKDNITPEEYASFKEFITEMNEADNKQYGIK